MKRVRLAVLFLLPFFLASCAFSVSAKYGVEMGAKAEVGKGKEPK